MNFVLVAAGGALGSVCRYGATLVCSRLFGMNFPYGTLFVNVTGSFLMGALIELIARRFGASNELRLFLATGFLGGYTTFSSFSLDAGALWERGALALALFYVATSVVLGLAALVAGLSLVRSFA